MNNQSVVLVDGTEQFYDTKGLDQLPSSLLFNVNLRYVLSDGEWWAIRKQEYERASNACEWCHAKDKMLHCHEQWAYTIVHSDTAEPIATQELVNLVVLCEDCHSLKHMGLVGIKVDSGEVALGTIMQHFFKLHPRCTEAGFWKANRSLHDRDLALAYLLSTRWTVTISSQLAQRIEALVGKNKETIDLSFKTLVEKNTRRWCGR
jgi:hypothetical protein